MSNGKSLCPRTRRNLTLLSKFIMKLADGSKFGTKESYMAPFNDRLDSRLKIATDFLLSLTEDSLSKNFEDLRSRSYVEIPPAKLDRKDLFTLHSIIWKYRSKLIKSFPPCKKVLKELGEPIEVPETNEFYKAMTSKSPEASKQALSSAPKGSLLFAVKQEPTWDPVTWCVLQATTVQGEQVLATEWMELLYNILIRGGNTIYLPGILRLFVALKWKDPELHCRVFSLLISRCDINEQNPDGETALHKAALLEVEESIYFLCANGANVNICTRSKHSPLHYAIFQKKVLSVKALLSAGADTTNLDLSKMSNAGGKLSEILQVIEEFNKSKKNEKRKSLKAERETISLENSNLYGSSEEHSDGTLLLKHGEVQTTKQKKYLPKAFERAKEIRQYHFGDRAKKHVVPVPIITLLREIQTTLEDLTRDCTVKFSTQEPQALIYAQGQLYEAMKKLSRDKELQNAYLQSYWVEQEKKLPLLQACVRRWLAQDIFLKELDKYKRNELIHTEEAKSFFRSVKIHLAELHLIVEQFKKPLIDRKLLPSHEVDSIFCNIEEIYLSHKAVHADLEKYFQPSLNHQPKKLKEILDNQVAVLEMYTKYGKHMPAAIEKLNQLRIENDDLDLFIKKLEGETVSNPLSMLLREITSKPIFFANQIQSLVEKNLAIDLFDFEALTDITNQVKKKKENLIFLCNRAESREKVVALSGQISGRPSGPISGDISRYFIKEIRSRVEGEDCLFLLFSDLLMRVRPRTKEYIDEFAITSLFSFNVPSQILLQFILSPPATPKFHLQPLSAQLSVSFSVLLSQQPRITNTIITLFKHNLFVHNSLSAHCALSFSIWNTISLSHFLESSLHLHTIFLIKLLVVLQFVFCHIFSRHLIIFSLHSFFSLLVRFICNSERPYNFSTWCSQHLTHSFDYSSAIIGEAKCGGGLSE
eukprot:TRINITY_DN7915_c0_g1_i1.p1 TRINITY_DN7915_c0_g1~~TRINITY_DN7915_c0_g1_i1.p1  ORF type:complete len:930 (-),score=238.77 TRINITY_DN7915_c0_g1_i1:278-3067(-)